MLPWNIEAEQYIAIYDAILKLNLSEVCLRGFKNVNKSSSSSPVQKLYHRSFFANFSHIYLNYRF